MTAMHRNPQIQRRVCPVAVFLTSRFLEASRSNEIPHLCLKTRQEMVRMMAINLYRFFPLKGVRFVVMVKVMLTTRFQLRLGLYFGPEFWLEFALSFG